MKPRCSYEESRCAAQDRDKAYCPDEFKARDMMVLNSSIR